MRICGVFKERGVTSVLCLLFPRTWPTYQAQPWLRPASQQLPSPGGPWCPQAMMAVVGPAHSDLWTETLGSLCCPCAPGGPVLRVLVAQGHYIPVPVAVLALQGCQLPPLLKALGPPGRLQVREAVADEQLCSPGCSAEWTVGDGLKMARNFTEGCRKPFPLLRACPHSVIPAVPPPWVRKARLLRAQESVPAC